MYFVPPGILNLISTSLAYRWITKSSTVVEKNLEHSMFLDVPGRISRVYSQQQTNKKIILNTVLAVVR